MGQQDEQELVVQEHEAAEDQVAQQVPAPAAEPPGDVRALAREVLDLTDDGRYLTAISDHISDCYAALERSVTLARAVLAGDAAAEPPGGGLSAEERAEVERIRGRLLATSVAIHKTRLPPEELKKHFTHAAAVFGEAAPMDMARLITLLDRVCGLGFAEPSAHGDWYITEEGKTAAAQQVPASAEAPETGRCLWCAESVSPPHDCPYPAQAAAEIRRRALAPAPAAGPLEELRAARITYYYLARAIGYPGDMVRPDHEAILRHAEGLQGKWGEPLCPAPAAEPPGDVRALAREVLRLDGEATPEPWELGQAGSANLVHFDGEDIRGAARSENPRNRALIAHYRTAAPALARAVLVGDAESPGPREAARELLEARDALDVAARAHQVTLYVADCTAAEKEAAGKTRSAASKRVSDAWAALRSALASKGQP